MEKHIAKKAKAGAALSYHMLSAFATVTIDKWDNFQTINYPHGHCILTGYMGLRPQDPDTLAYDKVMIKAYGQKRFEEIVGVNIHHVLVYPGLSVQSPLQQLRAVRPLGVDRTLTEIWHFRLKGAPEAIYRRSLAYYNLVNSPATLINADDLENFWKCHQGLSSDGGDWVSFARHHGRDIEKDGGVERAEQGHLRSADAQPDEGLGEVHAAHESRTYAVEQFLYRQAELLDGKVAGLDRPLHAGRHLLDAARARVHDLGRHAGDLRRGQEPDDGAHGRVLHPDAWSQRPLWGTNHVVSNV